MPSPNIPTYSKIGLMYIPITPIYKYVPNNAVFQL